MSVPIRLVLAGLALLLAPRAVALEFNPLIAVKAARWADAQDKS